MRERHLEIRNPGEGKQRLGSAGDAQDSTLEMYFLLTKLFNTLDDADRQFFAEFSLSTRQYWTLHHLMTMGSMSMIDLSRLLLTDKSNVTTIIDRLEQAGLVKRTPDTQDRRVTVLSLTPEGLQRYTQVHEAHQAHIHELLASEEATLHCVIDMLHPILHRIEAFLHPTPTP